MNQTKNYQLNLIETSDPFSPSAINQNTQKIEDALVTHTVSQTAHSDIRGTIEAHTENKKNPHGVTAEQIGAAPTSHNHSADNVTSGVLGVARGGTGQNTAQKAAVALINALNVGPNPPVDADYFIAQSTAGGTADTTYWRKPVSTLWSYIKGKANYVYAALNHGHSAGDITGGTLPVARGGTGNTVVDTTPTSGSTKMVTSGGIYAALEGKFVTGTYTGSGVLATAKSISLGFQPKAVFIIRSSNAAEHTGFAVCIRSGSYQGSLSTSDKPTSNVLTFCNGNCSITSDGFSVTKTAAGALYSLNEENVTYVYMALK